MLRRGLAVLLLCSSSAVLAESYITDSMNVGVYASEDLSGQPLIYVKSGDRIEVVESKGDKSLVLTAGEEVGWMRSTFITTREPLIKQLEQAREEIKQLEADLEEAQSKQGTVAAKEKEADKNIAWMRAEMNKARKKAEELEAQLKELKAAREEKVAQQSEQQAEAQGELAQLIQEKEALEKQLAATLMINDSFQPESNAENGSLVALLAPVVTLLLGLGLGAAACYRWMDNRLTKRFGGIRFH